MSENELNKLYMKVITLLVQNIPTQPAGTTITIIVDSFVGDEQSSKIGVLSADVIPAHAELVLLRDRLEFAKGGVEEQLLKFN